MATTSVTMTATCLNGKPLEALERLIAQRQREMGETTSEAAIATAINVLTSIRAATKVADPKKDSGFVTVIADPSLVVSFRPIGKRHVLCLRRPGEKHHAKVKWANAAGAPHAGFHRVTQVYFVRDRYSDRVETKTEKQYYIIAHNQKEAMEYAVARRARRIKNLCGLAKWTIGVAQARIHDNFANIPVSPVVQRIGQTAQYVIVDESGFSNGKVYVEVNDMLKYAALALKGGPGAVDTALMRAANRTAGIINAHLRSLGFDDDRKIPTPFPEIKRRK
ncbi:MAG: hypothetical protein IJQ73_09395 [Kiritimatiellae bacterium]|nr:hypothetical protein [Kiritimatiellia bacterium]